MGMLWGDWFAEDTAIVTFPGHCEGVVSTHVPVYRPSGVGGGGGEEGREREGRGSKAGSLLT